MRMRWEIKGGQLLTRRIGKWIVKSHSEKLIASEILGDVDESVMATPSFHSYDQLIVHWSRI